MGELNSSDVKKPRDGDACLTPVDRTEGTVEDFLSRRLFLIDDHPVLIEILPKFVDQLNDLRASASSYRKFMLLSFGIVCFIGVGVKANVTLFTFQISNLEALDLYALVLLSLAIFLHAEKQLEVYVFRSYLLRIVKNIYKNDEARLRQIELLGPFQELWALSTVFYLKPQSVRITEKSTYVIAISVLHQLSVVCIVAILLGAPIALLFSVLQNNDYSLAMKIFVAILATATIFYSALASQIEDVKLNLKKK